MADGVLFIVSGRPLRVSLHLWKAMQGDPLPRGGYACDGCSNSPDALGHLKLWPACVIHDHDYREKQKDQARNWHSRWRSDKRLRTNMTTLVRMQGGSKGHARRLAWLYWGRVRIWGGSSYQHWDEGEAPLGRWQLFREAWGLWKAKDAQPA